MLKAPLINSLRGDGILADDIVGVDTLASGETTVLGGIGNGLEGSPPLDSAPTNTATATAPMASTGAGSLDAGTAAAVTIAGGGSAEIDGAGAQPVTFTGTTGTLKIDHSLAYTGQVSGLAGSDALDLADVSFGAATQATFLGNTSGGTLTITDGTHTANIALQGNYLSSHWNLSGDGKGGTVVVDPVPANTWQALKVGAGGYLSGIDVAPDGTMVVRTDTYGAYIWNGTQWQQLVTSTSMPAAEVTTGHNQGVYEIQIASSNSNILYMMYDGYVFKSTNKGTTWTQTSFAQVTESPNDGYRGNGQKMAIDPSNPNVVYVGTPQNGLFVTTDGGTTWQKVSGVPGSLADPGNGQYPGITGIVFDPALGTTAGKTNTVFAASYGNGVYESTDGGATWAKLNGGPSHVEYAAVSSTGAYYVTSDNKLWRYVNGAWTALLTDTTGQGIHSVAIDPFNPSHIVVQTPAGYLNVSNDGGATWGGLDWSSTQLSSADIPWLAGTGTGSFMSIGGTVFDPLVAGKLWASDGVGVWNASVPANVHWNTSITWNSQSVGIEQLVANDMVVAPGGKPVLASWDRPFFYINDPTQFPTTYGPTSGTQIVAGWSVDYASSSPNFLVGIADWWGVEESGYSTNGGQTWTVFPSMPAFAGQTIGGTIAASSPTDIVWAPADGFQPYYTLNGGATWNPVVLPGVSSWAGFDFAYYLNPRTVTADRVLANTFYMYFAGNGVYKSTNGGATWAQVFNGTISPFPGGNGKIESVPGKAGDLFYTGGPSGGPHPAAEGFFHSTDGGATWTAVANVLEVSTFGFGAPATPGGYPSIYIVGYVNSVYGVWQSNNDAQSWTQIGTWPAGSLDQIKTISGDPNIYGQVYVGFQGSGFAYLPAAPAVTGPSVTGVVTSPSSGDLNAGKTVTLTLNLSAAVTVAGGIPTLTLNDGGTATYLGGSGSTALTFSYTVAAGQNTPDMAVTAINLNSATVKDGSGNAADLTGAVTNPAGTLQIDTTAPAVTQVTASPASGVEFPGNTITLTLAFGEAVTVTGTPTLTLNDGGTATYLGGTGTNALTFSYTVGSSDSTVSTLAITQVNLPSGATVADAAGNAANLSGALTSFPGLGIDPPPLGPTLNSILESPLSGDLNAGHTVTLTLNLSGAVTVAGGVPTLTLNDGGTATYTGGSGTNALTFSYTVAAGQNTADLTVTTINPGTATVTDGAGNTASLSLGGLIQNGPQIDTTTPTVSSVAASGTGITAGAGDLAAGSAVTLTLNLSEAVTVAGGIPTLTLNDGGTATYTGGSGTNALTFSYTVAAGQNTADLTVTTINPGTATVTDGAGNTANLTGAVTNPAGALQIDTTTPTVSSVATSGTGIVAGTGDLSAGNVVTLTINMNEAVTVTGGTPTLTLNDGGTATYTGGSGTNALTFSYTVAAGQNTPDLTATAVNLNAANVKDGAGNAANLTGVVTNPAGTLQIDTTTSTVSPTAISLVESPATGTLNAGKTVTLTLNFNEAVTVVGGVPTLTLNDGSTATYTGGSGTSALTFSYTVAAGQNTSALAATGCNFNGASVVDHVGITANTYLGGLTQTGPRIDTTTSAINSVIESPASGDFTAGGVVTLTINLSNPVTVAGGVPTLTLNDGGTATYTGGSGSNALTFSYTVAAGQNTASLAATAVNLNGATVRDSGGSAASLSLSGLIQTGPQIDTTTPTVSSVVTSGTGITAGAGDLAAGSVVTLNLNLSEAVTVAGGVPTLTLNDGGTATYTGGSGTNTLTFSYTVAAGQNTADLTVTAVNLSAATVTDGAGNAANLTGAVTSPAGTLQIDTNTPTVASVVTSGTGITAGAGDLAAGGVVALTLNLSEVVTVAGGTPTLTLNDGGTATYAGGSGTNALTFSYTVPAGQNTADLTVTSVNVNSATVKDGAGNAVNLAAAVTNPAGTLQIDTTPPAVTQVMASPASGVEFPGDTITFTLAFGEAVTVTGIPTLILNDGGTATYLGGTGSNALTFGYTVGSTDRTVSALAITQLSLPGGATIVDAAGNAANLSGAVTSFPSLGIDPPTPTLNSIVESPLSGDLNAGQAVTLTLNMSSAVTVAGGVPTLTLNDGGTATYTGGSGSNALTFSYTVGAGQNTPNLTVTAVNLNGATVQDSGGTAAGLSLIGLTQTGSQIDTTPPNAPVIQQSSASLGTITLNGLAEANSTVTVFDGTTTLGAVTASVSGAWTLKTGASFGAHAFTASATDAAGNTSAASSPYNQAINTITEAVTISGTPVEGQTLTASVLTNDANANLSYQWQRYVKLNGVWTWTNIGGTNAATYTTGVADKGVLLKVGVTATDGMYSSRWTAATVNVRPASPVLSIANGTLSVTAGGDVALGLGVTVPLAGDNVTVRISGLPGYETITDNLDHRIFSGSWITLTAAEVNSGLSLHSNYTGTGHPVASLHLVAANGTAASATQVLTVIDPPATSPTQQNSLALLTQFAAASFATPASPAVTTFTPNQQSQEAMLASAH